MTRTQTFTYDTMDRLGTAAEAGNWSQQYVYDGVGNRALYSGSNDASQGVDLSLVAKTTDLNSVPFDAKNRWSAQGVTYDNAGNLQSVLGGPVTFQAGYDAENRQTNVTTTFGTTNYSYDGEGRRVKKVVGGVATYYLYDTQGNLAMEVGGTTGSGTLYLTSDMLGSTRMATPVNGSSVGTPSRWDYLPFGQEIPTTWGGRTNYQPYAWQTIKFTSKERDVETGLDWFDARYFSGSQGRFTSPDPLLESGRPQDPQSWNRYAYGFNNPLRYVDPSGLDPISAEDCRRDPACTVVPINVIYDRNANIYDQNGNVFAEIQARVNAQIAEAADEYGNVNVAFDVSYTSGAVTVEKGKITVTGLVDNAVNVAITDSNGVNSTITPGASYVVGGRSTTLLSMYHLTADTLSHELAHHFTGDTHLGEWMSALNAFSDINNDWGRGLMRNWNSTPVRVLRAIDPFLGRRLRQSINNARQWYSGR